MASTIDPATFLADVAALVAKEAAVLSPAQVSQIEGIAQGTATKVEADVVAGKDPIPDIVTGLNQVDAVINATAPCFVEGTAIATSRGDVAVEKLAAGDLVVTAAGQQRAIKWLGHRTTDCSRHDRPDDVLPVRVSAHALGENRPARDLLVSPGHALCVDVLGEVLIPACRLINGTTITQEDVDSVTYWHVELGSHDVILAESLPCESYLEMGNRSFFAGGDVVTLNALPDAQAVTHADFCRPFYAEGALVDVVRAQLTARARGLGWTLEEQGLGDLHLEVDGKRIDPQVRGLSARFSVPTQARDMWLVSSTNVPAHIGDGSDRRTLGVCVRGVAIDDGFGDPRSLSVEDPRLSVGFYGVEDIGSESCRWTNGRASLPAELWSGVESDFFLRVDLTGSALPRWTETRVAMSPETAVAA